MGELKSINLFVFFAITGKNSIFAFINKKWHYGKNQISDRNTDFS